MLTPAEKHLVLGLKIMGCSEVEMLAIVMGLYTVESQIAMMDWMCEHRDATPLELLARAKRLAPQNPYEEEE